MVFSIFLFIQIFFIAFLVYSDENKNPKYYLNLKTEYGFDGTIHFYRYGIQKILNVPDVEVHIVDKKKIVTYRTDFHNGTTDNGCLKIFNKVEDDKLTPFFVLEELLLRPWGDGYYQRVVKKFSFNELEFEVYEIITKPREENRKILDVIMKRDKKDFVIKSVTEFHKGYSSWISPGSSEIYDSLKHRILRGDY